MVKPCPRCGSEEVVPIVYGFPDGIALDLAHQGKVALGGCDILESNPIWRCSSCRREWGEEDSDAGGRRDRDDALRRIFAEYVPTPESTLRAERYQRRVQPFLDSYLPAAVSEGADRLVVQDGLGTDAHSPAGRSWPATLGFGDKVEIVERYSYQEEVIEQLGEQLREDEPGVIEVRAAGVDIRVECLLHRDQEFVRLEFSLQGLRDAGLPSTGQLRRMPVCPKCGGVLRTEKARQCFWCGADWHASSAAGT